MPPQRPRFERVQLNTRVRVEIEQTLQRFVVDHNTTVQSSVDLALAEFLAARGYPLLPADSSLAQTHDDGRSR
ncbi:hypothetical protein GCM10018962_17220 [Dactylosporangium matsuzakiense]|uniref:Uncharacterized protein n=2 Tax=Dactylosporangium matsuzakiense TaxID=53360 RepID=A0A9W6NLD7_9ACTN|nr:hypothetical protein GCM10017581_035820 [Dactylosporangium matsuzakiense]